MLHVTPVCRRSLNEHESQAILHTDGFMKTSEPYILRPHELTHEKLDIGGKGNLVWHCSESYPTPFLPKCTFKYVVFADVLLFVSALAR